METEPSQSTPERSSPTQFNKFSLPMSASATATVEAQPNVSLFPAPETLAKKPVNKWFMTTAPATFDNVALVAAGLGALIGIGVLLSFKFFTLGMYFLAMGIFHLLEFWTTARYNASKLGMNSFLLSNGIGYITAHIIAACEIIYRRNVCAAHSRVLTAVALISLFGGQVVRTLAMIEASQSFNHFVQVEKRPEHKLVKTGIYSLMRHPSYFGYYFWAVGAQLLVRNWASFAVFAVVLNVYFRQRLGPEEAALWRFFGKEYERYEQEVWSGIFLH